jgi:transposase
MDASEALSRYRDSDAEETLFRTIKSLLGMDTFRVHSTESVEGKCFLSFLAAIIWNEMYLAMKPLKKEEKDRKHYTVPAMMKEMEKVFVTKDAKGNYRKKYALTARQKKILKAFGLEEKNLDSYIRKLSPSLKARSTV